MSKPRRNEKTDVPPPRYELARPNDRTLIGRLHISEYDGSPITAAQLAQLLDTDVEDVELRGGVLRPWLAMVIVDGVRFVYGRNVMGEDSARACIAESRGKRAA